MISFVLISKDEPGLDGTLTARLEDAEGWPITKPGPLSRLERELTPGRYRLVVLPHFARSRYRGSTSSAR